MYACAFKNGHGRFFYADYSIHHELCGLTNRAVASKERRDVNE